MVSGFIVLSSVGALAIASVFCLLLWAAVQDGRIEAAHQLEAARRRGED